MNGMPRWLAPLALTVPPVVPTALVFVPLSTRFGLSGWQEYAVGYGVYIVMTLFWIAALIALARRQAYRAKVD